MQLSPQSTPKLAESCGHELPSHAHLYTPGSRPVMSLCRGACSRATRQHLGHQCRQRWLGQSPAVPPWSPSHKAQTVKSATDVVNLARRLQCERSSARCLPPYNAGTRGTGLLSPVYDQNPVGPVCMWMGHRKAVGRTGVAWAETGSLRLWDRVAAGHYGCSAASLGLHVIVNSPRWLGRSLDRGMSLSVSI